MENAANESSGASNGQEPASGLRTPPHEPRGAPPPPPPREEGGEQQQNNGPNQRGRAEAPPPNRNNNQARNLATVRERLFQALFFRITLLYARALPPSIRRLFEFVVLMEALAMLSLLIYIHMAFLKSPITCLDHMKNVWPKDGILRVEVIKSPEENYDLKDSYFKEEQIRQRQMAYMSAFASDFQLMFEGAMSPVDFLEASDEEKSDEERQDYSKDSSEEIIFPDHEVKKNSFWDSFNIFATSEVDKDSLGRNRSQPLRDADDAEGTPGKKNSRPGGSWQSWTDEDYIVEYALEHGFLKLTAFTRHRLNIPVKLVVLDSGSNPCFGDALSRFVLNEFLGYDDILMNSFKSLTDETEDKKGYVRNVVTGEYYRFVNMLPTSGNYFYAAFIMALFTLSVTILLRYSHHQIFLFIIHLLQMLEFNIAVSFPAAPMITVILALVGMEAIMSEFFRDTSTAFYVIVLIWLSDQYEAICCHTAITKRHWLRFFYLYHFAFYAYHYRFNGQYSGIALMTSWLFILHSKLYFFHHYELPALLQQAQVVGRLQTLNIVLRNIPNAEGGAGDAPPRDQAPVAGGEVPPEPATGANGGGGAAPPDQAARHPRGRRQVINFVLRNAAAAAAQPTPERRPLSLRQLLQNLRNVVQNAQQARRVVAPPPPPADDDDPAATAAGGRSGPADSPGEASGEVRRRRPSSQEGNEANDTATAVTATATSSASPQRTENTSSGGDGPSPQPPPPPPEGDLAGPSRRTTTFDLGLD